MAKLRIGGDRAREHEVKIGQGCSWSDESYAYSLHASDDRRRVRVRLNAREALRVLEFLGNKRAEIERAAAREQEGSK